MYLDQANQTRENAYKFIEVLNEMISSRVFNSIFYISCVDIEKSVLKSLKLMGYSSNHVDIHNFLHRLQYPITILGNITIADTCELISLNLKSLWSNIWI
jgi:hypothetical protein